MEKGRGREFGKGEEDFLFRGAGRFECYLPPAAFGFLEKTDGEGIHEFVRINDGVSLAGSERGVNGRMVTGAVFQKVFLAAGEGGRGFDQVQGGSHPEGERESSENIFCECA